MPSQLLPALFHTLLLLAPPELDTAMADAMSAEDLSEGATKLEAAIGHVLADPELLARHGSVDPQLLESLTLLASLYIAVEERSRAGEVLDLLLRLDPQEQAPVRSYGRALFELYEARRDALHARGQATLELVCQGPCEVLLDGHRHQAPLRESISMGSHVLWLRSTDDANSSWVQREIEFSHAGQSERIEFGEAAVPRVSTEPAPPPAPAPAPTLSPASQNSPKRAPTSPASIRSTPARVAPRGLEIAGLVIGTAALATGVVALIARGRCKNSWEVADSSMAPHQCPTIFEPDPRAFGALAGLGGALALASSITLGIDEQRVAGKRGTQYSLSYRIAF